MNAITPNDDTELDKFNEGVWVTGDAGDIVFTFFDDTDSPALAFGSNNILKIRFKKIKATGTDATGIYGLKFSL